MKTNLSSSLISQSHTKKAVYKVSNTTTKNRTENKVYMGVFFHGYVDQEKVSFNAQMFSVCN